MAVALGDLVSPVGELDVAVLFPDDTDAGEARLTGYITAAEARVSDSLTGDEADEAVSAFAYHRAYLAKYQTELAAASSGGLSDQGQYAVLWSQINAWKELADAKLAEFEGLLPPEAEEVVASSLPPTTSTRVNYDW
ncbi:MAG TPA: hypothetical protein VEB19_06200 [Gemmatimonadaceae bacterium]|nr:hypothetical protein [Gemmatimonadaceae bacterium]